ncbi:hypothetical protein [Mycobacteroides abscessus]|uniref:hypothetical protein n=1 Tax=Mycobacteroides abscessus TaxID=36809 RepID=UPI00035DA828|nr:hypothetical protein [Mycobacteroides abscessus]OLT88751.1 hypothetical protein BKG58_10030 [Mycobacteroides abscessus subsp. abscessus]
MDIGIVLFEPGEELNLPGLQRLTSIGAELGYPVSVAGARAPHRPSLLGGAHITAPATGRTKASQSRQRRFPYSSR